MKEKNLLKWIWLSLACRPGSALPSTLLKFFGSVEKVYEATEEDLEAVETNFYGHEKELCEKDLDEAKEVLAYCRKNKIGIMTPEDYFYPERFRALPNKPPVLYYLGNFCDLDNRFTVGVVGTRHPSAYGLHAAKRISYDLCRSGAVIVSGLAAGIDAAAHKAALYHESFTVGVLGCGIDQVYPKENKGLYEEVIKSGLVITEFRPGTAPMGKNFPVRNRLISALSDAVCVIEGSEQSGALITAEYALKQEKALYTVPGSIFARECAGSNFLLKVGAKPCLSAYDLVEDFRAKYPALEGALSLFGKAKAAPPPKKKNPNLKKKLRSYVFPGSERAEEETVLPPQFEVEFVEEEPKKEANISYLIELSEQEREVLSLLGFEPTAPDALLSESMSASEVLRTLTKLEIKGLVARAAGGKYVLCDRAEA